MQRAFFLTAAVAMTALAMGLFTPAEAQQKKEVVVVTWGGSMEEGHKKVYGEPFTRDTGINAKYVTWNGTISFIRAQVETKTVTNDIYPLNPWDTVAGCDEGLLEKLDPKELGIDPADFYEGGVEPCGVAADIWTYLLAWNADKNPQWTEKTGPQNIKDMFDLQKFPGRRGLRKRAYITLEYGLWGDGVATKDLYKVLATPAGLKRALAKLDSVKKNTLFLDTIPQMPQALADGETDYSSIVNARWYHAKVYDKKNFMTNWNDQVYSYNMWSIPKGTPRLKETKEFLKYVMQPRKLADLTDYMAYPPARKSALELVKPEVRANLATAHFNNELYLSARFWADNLDSYAKSFQTWLAQ